MPEEVDVLKEFKTITDLLLFLRKTGKLLGVKVDEQEKLKLEMKRITQVIVNSHFVVKIPMIMMIYKYKILN